MIDRFEGSFAFLSNFFVHSFEWGEIEWMSGEHAFQAFKTDDPYKAIPIIAAETPGHAKRLGRSVKLRPDWEEVKDDVMRMVIRAKFTGDTLMLKGLQNTGDEELVEGNRWHDNYWGNCTCVKCEGKAGLNVLGSILMEVREELKYAHPVIDD